MWEFLILGLIQDKYVCLLHADPRVSGVAIEVGPLAAGYGKLMEIRRCASHFFGLIKAIHVEGVLQYRMYTLMIRSLPPYGPCDPLSPINAQNTRVTTHADPDLC